MSLSVEDITAVILAGGQGRRMNGQDKGLLEFNGEALIAILLRELERQAVATVINANRNLDRYRAYGLPVISDRLEDYQGPLAGFASAMDFVDSDFILTLPCDGPLIAADYVERFIASQKQSGASICVAFDGERLQPVHALMRTDLLASRTSFSTAAIARSTAGTHYTITSAPISPIAPACFAISTHHRTGYPCRQNYEQSIHSNSRL